MTTIRMVNNKSEHTARLKENLEKQLSRLLQNLKYLRKFIVKKKSAIKIEIQKYPEIAPILKGIKRDSPGNLRIECDHSEILDEIAEIGSVYCDRRRHDTTCDENLGFKKTSSLLVR